LKLANLLAHYLYSNKRLDLPGIGSFLLDPSVIIEPENSKQRPAIPQGISFESNPSIRDASELIEHICTTTGKMKPLAAADLDSHLQLAQQFLNIGKPFSFEGIGSLVKLYNGEFEFIQGNIVTDKLKDEFEKEGLSKKETIEAKYLAFLATPSAKSRLRKPVIALLALCGIGLAIWGGYTISSKNSEPNGSGVTETSAEQTMAVTDSSQYTKPDSTSSQKTDILAANYKYVLEVAKAKRAFRRYNQLKEIFWDVKLETNDSVQYKLFMLLPASRDSTRMVDSLTALTGRKVYLENRN
jgi:hypothetical protein